MPQFDHQHRVETLAELDDFKFTTPVRFTFPHPLRGGPKIRDIRARLAPYGHIYLSFSNACVFVDMTPGQAQPPVVTLDMIARSDAAGLERAIQSAIAHVDYIIVGIDARSDVATQVTADALADIVHTFTGDDIGVSAEDWADNKIHFSNARNIGRAMVPTPWTLVLDTDEYFTNVPKDIRASLLYDLTTAGVTHVEIGVDLGKSVMRDTLRLTRTHYRWHRGTHNQLNFSNGPDETTFASDIMVLHDTSLRTKIERERRAQQRVQGMLELEEASDNGDLNATFHIAKQYIADGDVTRGVDCTLKFRSHAEVRGPAAAERAMLACGLAELQYRNGNYAEAELWAFRALLDGPTLEAFYKLGDVAEDRGDLHSALFWFDCACRAPASGNFTWIEGASMRWGRREGIRRAIANLSDLPPELAAPMERPAP